MSRLQYLARKPLPVYNQGQSGTSVGTNTASSDASSTSMVAMFALSSDASSAMVPIVALSFDANEEWFITPVPGAIPDIDGNSDPYFMIQHSDPTTGHPSPQLVAFVPPSPDPQVDDPVFAGPFFATTWRMQYIDGTPGGHIMYLAQNPSLCWSLSSDVPGTNVTLQLNPLYPPGTTPTQPVDASLLWFFDK